jgi:hypothetical protein
MQQAISIKIHDEFATGLDSVDDGSGGL